MWNRFSIKIQLIIFMTLLVSVIEIATLAITINIQKSNNKSSAIDDAQNILKSLNNDLLKTILNPNTDGLSDITFRLYAFSKITGVVLVDDNDKSIYQYKDTKHLIDMQDTIIKKKIVFDENIMYLKRDIVVDDYVYGYSIIGINLESYIAKNDELQNTILLIFLVALFFAIFISIFLSKNYTEPFKQIITAMKNSNPSKEKSSLIHTNAKNEIKDLFDGYNQAMGQIYTSSQALNYQAQHDQLTGIYNRYFIETKIQEALKDETSTQNALIILNLDQFKIINNTASFEAGDMLLKMIAGNIKNNLPNGGTCARVDGDTFMIIVQNTSNEKAKELLSSYLDKLSDFRFIWKEETFSTSACMSMVLFKANEYTIKELMKNANAALSTAKSLGTNKSYIYEANDESTMRFSNESQTAVYVKEALNGGPSRFELFAQDIVPLQYETNNVSYEILIRMWDKNDNFVSPDDFLPTAQRYQMMVDIDIFVLWTYLETVSKNKEHIQNLHSAHINLAGSSLTNIDFQNKVKEAVEYFDFPWDKLELEVTETSAVGDFTQANEFIVWLKNVGIGLALDDFGTGMASFEYLKSLPFDTVKIDGSFVKDMHNDPIDKAVIKYIQEIATLKNQETVAEYVETKEDVNELKKLGITYGQGYYLGKPRPLSSWM